METLISILITLGASVVFAIVGTVLGCLLSGIDRIISARMQGRVGPPLLQPLYDVRKLFAKDNVAVNGTIGTYVVCALIFTFLAGGIFFSGGNFLLCVFVITLAELMFVMAAYASRSPFSEAGAHRENLQIMAYEPMVLLLAVGFFQATGSFDIAILPFLDSPIIFSLWGVFLGMLFILTIKLRKSPFDLSYSHHAHQEPGTIVKIFKDAIGVKVQDGVYIITEFQLEGKKRMLVKDYLNGHNIFEVDQKFE